MNRIYVFSSTGTSLQTAKDVAEHLNDVEILSIPVLMKEEKWSITGDTVGFIFPCYYGTIPQIVQRFIEGAHTVNSPYFYGVTTSGRDSGYSLKKLDELLRERESKLLYGRKIAIASNYMNGWYYNMIQPDKEVVMERVRTAGEKAALFAADIKERKEYREQSEYLNYRLPRIISPARYVKDTRPWDSEFSVTEACRGCGICSRVCPVDNITMEENKPAFTRNCQRCMACIQYCPQSAMAIEGRRMNKPKYTHPHITRQEMIAFNRTP